MRFATGLHAKCTACLGRVALHINKLDPVNRAFMGKGQQGRRIVGRPKTEFDGAALAIGPSTGAAQLGRVQFVMRDKRGIETAHAAKSAGHGDLRHGQLGIGQQLLGAQQAAGLQVLQGRHAKLCFKNSSHVSP